MTKHYIFFTRSVLPKPNAAHLVHDVHSANAAANLGYSTVLVYLRKKIDSRNPVDWLFPFQPQPPDENLVRFYSIQRNLKVSPLPMPWPLGRINQKWASPSTVLCKYYFPVHIFPKTRILHTLDWNLVKTAIRQNIPVIYEREHYQKERYEPAIVNNPLFQVAVTVADPIREDMIRNGMPPEKILKLHLGYNQEFAIKQPEKAWEWRQKLLKDGRQHLVIYAGGLYRFKGVDMLIDVAIELPHVQFVFAGGDDEKVDAYRQLARDKQAQNVTFLGYVAHAQLASLLQAADILAHPHLSGEAATFTSPLKFFDYMASGTPIVATEIPPLMEFKFSNVVAAWCEPDNPTQFKDCIQQVLQTYSQKSDAYSSNIDFVQQFSWENRIRKILSYVGESIRPQPII